MESNLNIQLRVN